MDENISSPCKDSNVGVEVQLQTEVDHLKQHLAERDAHFVALESEYYKCTSRNTDLEEQLNTQYEKYERLYDSYKKVQKLNQVLEDKLLQLVDKMKSEKSQLTKDVATLSVRLAESKHSYSMLQKENERYKNDMNLAIQLLQCKPDNFVAQKLDNLPVDTQARVSQYVMSKSAKPTSLNTTKPGNDIDTFDASEYEFNISASLMTKILEDSIQDTVTKHCDTCSCSKSQNKPFCYDESNYTVSTQTTLSGDIKPILCLNCKTEIRSLNSELSEISISPPVITLANDKTIKQINEPVLVVPQSEPPEEEDSEYILRENLQPNPIRSKIKIDDYFKKELILQKVDREKYKNNGSVNMEPSVHHKLCDRTKTSISSIKSSHSVGNEELPVKEILRENPGINQSPFVDSVNIKKNSHSSMGGGSRTSSIAKSTVSTHKSTNPVGPGPRFCHLRMQAGSKNILLDNAEPDVPPVLYKRQSKCNENSIFKDLDNFIDLDKSDDEMKTNNNNDNLVVETTLIDVHVDSNNKESNASDKSTSINPILLNVVSSAPLQPLKTHNFCSNNDTVNNEHSTTSHQISEIDNLLNDFHPGNANSVQENLPKEDHINKKDVTPTDSHDVKIFNFDRYEQNKIAAQFTRPLKKIEMSQLHSLENTKISKDLPPPVITLNNEKPVDQIKQIPNIVNVYPNLTQTHLKANESKFIKEQSTSSLSSDDSAALLQKQQLLRVAEWVEKNLEQQNNLNDPLEDECNFANRSLRHDSKINRLTETLNELAMNMPHPVSKYSKTFSREARNNWAQINANTNNATLDKAAKHNANVKLVNNVVKETIFPVENDVTVTEINDKSQIKFDHDPNKELRDVLKAKGGKDISPEDLARMEYNVKKFLLSGPCWVNSNSVGRSRRTSSKTETDV
ncbi:uncharacterized protein LOC126974065 [Leptidea sinapis]|uniref:uncharacterized protein LOC126974065 n=1 Tax=Leptidea sinapis TaxID=189913 RepID=UPI00213C0A2C|nr:uncharacterized protein LOC126974065 [Leptidea sinapis]